MIAIDGHQILAALQQEAAACRQLASLRDQQRRLIDAGEAEKLLEVLAEKGRAISRISELEEQLKPLKASWNDCCDQLPALERAQIGEAFGKVRDLLEHLIARETEDAEALANRKESCQPGGGHEGVFNDDPSLEAAPQILLRETSQHIEYE